MTRTRAMVKMDSSAILRVLNEEPRRFLRVGTAGIQVKVDRKKVTVARNNLVGGVDVFRLGYDTISFAWDESTEKWVASS